MSRQHPSISKRVVNKVRGWLAKRLRDFHPGPGTFITAFCVGATLAEYIANVGATTPQAISGALLSLAAAIGVDRLADLIGDWEPKPGLTTEAMAQEIAQAVQERLECGGELPGVRALFQKFDVLSLALETWHQAEDERWQRLVEELSAHPQLIARQTTEAVLRGLDPRLATLEERTRLILELLETPPSVPAPGPPDFSTLLADYRDYLRELYKNLDLAGIPVPLDVSLPLDRVYIKLRALPEREEAALRKAEPPSERAEEVSRRLAEYLWQRREEWEEAARCLEEAQPIPPEEAIARHERLAILGEAGAGKSTLLRHLAWERAGDPQAPLPLLVPLGRADTLISQKGCSLLEAALELLTKHKVGREEELLKQALADAINDKKVLFLCDGLDEVHLARQSVVAGLQGLAADGHRLVVTSRPLGYERLAGLEHFQVLPLLPEDARAFTDRWFHALAQARGMPEAEQEEWARARAEWLKRQLQEQPGLHEVAQNPLLLTFLAVLAGDELPHDLPPHRKELYKEYVERLFTEWEARRREKPGKEELVLGRLQGEEARRVARWGLYRVAWHLHRAYYGEEGLRAVREEVEPLLAHDLKERWGFDNPLKAEALAAEVLGFWEKAGLLDVYRLRGQEWLAFRHLTFQEYGAARALAKMYGDNADGLWQYLSPYLLRPQWGGAIPLTLAHLPGKQATALVERLLAANENDEDQQRPLFLAAATLAEGAEVAAATHRRVVDGLLYLAHTRGPNAGDALNALGRLAGDDYAAAGLLALARDEAAEAWVRMLAAEALGELGRAEELLALARDEAVRAWVRVPAARALGRLGHAEEAAAIPLALARDEAVEAKVRVPAAEALGRLGRAEELLALARDEAAEAWVRMRAAEALSELGRAEEAAEAWAAIGADEAVPLEGRVTALHHAGWHYSWQHDYPRARDAFRQATELDPQLAEAWDGLGQACLGLGCTDQAIAAYERALALDPDRPFTHNNLADCYLEQGNSDEAEIHYRRRVALRPQDALHARVSLGVIATHRGEEEAAREHFQAALDMWETAWEAKLQSPYGLLANKALALLGLGRSQEALETLRQALAARSRARPWR